MCCVISGVLSCPRMVQDLKTDKTDIGDSALKLHFLLSLGVYVRKCVGLSS